MFSGGRQSGASQEDALEQLASIDLVQLCNEAKVELCRATRDLSSCGRYVEHVLNSCGHASLCAECSRRCDVCPICRKSLPKNGNRLKLRLFYKCIEAGLMPKIYDDRFQDREDSGKKLTGDIQRLYSFFDVALDNNLVSLICHYISDVCMDESAVSSDPVLAYLLDEVVVKDWCKRTFKATVCDLKVIYNCGVEDMKSKLPTIQKCGMKLTGISTVLEFMVSSFKDSFSAQLHDLHYLFESALKTKQHLEIMTWCLQHGFLQDVPLAYSDFDSWNKVVSGRKSFAKNHRWPDCLLNSADSALSQGTILFIEQALDDLKLEEVFQGEEEVDVLCLKDDRSPLIFRPKIDEIDRNTNEGCYPFENLRVAADILFLHGTSDTSIAKKAIFLYYIFDRHWAGPNKEWRHFVDDFTACFGVTRHVALESMVFYLLDDHTDDALKEAICLLLEIASSETHPRIAQVLLEHHHPFVALSVLQRSGHDGSCASTSLEVDDLCHVSLDVAVTSVRVRVECGLLTDAFMYQRAHCSKKKEKYKDGHMEASIGSKSGCWIFDMETLVTEICSLCIQKNLVGIMIELPWNSEEEKFLHKCLMGYACSEPSSVCGNLLVVYYLQRYRYIEASQVDHKLQTLEHSIMETADEEILLKTRSISSWRSSLVEKSLKMLPQVQQQALISESIGNADGFPSDNMPSELAVSNGLTTSAAIQISKPLISTFFVQANSDPSYEMKKTMENVQIACRVDTTHMNSANKAHSPFGVLHASLQSPCRVDASVRNAFSMPLQCNGGIECPSDIIPNNSMHQGLGDQRFGSLGTPLVGRSRSATKVSCSGRLENILSCTPEITSKGVNFLSTPNRNGILPQSCDQSSVILGKGSLLDISSHYILKEDNRNTSSRRKNSTPGGQNKNEGLRWRSDESSEDDEDRELNRYSHGATSMFQGRTRQRAM